MIGDLHVFEHVLDGKVRPKVVLDHFGHFHCQGRGIAGVALHGFDEPVEWQTQSSDHCQGFRRCLDARCRDHVGCDFDRSRLADLADLNNLFATRLEDRTRVP